MVGNTKCWFSHAQTQIFFKVYENHRDFGRYCGENVKLALTTESYTLFIKFISDTTYSGKGFEAEYVQVQGKSTDTIVGKAYGVYILQLIRFARVCNHVAEFNARNKCSTAKHFQQGYRYHKLRKTYSKFYRRHYELISKFNVGLKTLLREGLSKPEF